MYSLFIVNDVSYLNVYKKKHERCILFKKSTSFLDYGGGASLFYVHLAFCVDDVKGSL